VAFYSSSTQQQQQKWGPKKAGLVLFLVGLAKLREGVLVRVCICSGPAMGNFRFISIVQCDTRGSIRMVTPNFKLNFQIYSSFLKYQIQLEKSKTVSN